MYLFCELTSLWIGFKNLPIANNIISYKQNFFLCKIRRIRKKIRNFIKKVGLNNSNIFYENCRSFRFTYKLMPRFVLPENLSKLKTKKKNHEVAIL